MSATIKLPDVAPEWDKKIKEDFKNIGRVCERNGHEMDIMNNQTCMLGEVWNWNTYYADEYPEKDNHYCGTCDTLAQLFGEIGDMQIKLDEGETMFIHWNIEGRNTRNLEIELTQAGIKRRYNDTVKKLLKHVKEKHPKLIKKKTKGK